MALRSPRKRPAEDDAGVGSLLKKFRIVASEADSVSATSYSKSPQDTPFDARSEADTDITNPSPKGEARRLDSYQCPYDGCDKVYNRPCRLADHVRSHTKERPFLCTYEGCGKSFGRDTHLTRHIKSAHTDERKYNCEWEGCDKSFHTSQRLKNHQHVHENAERFRCTEYPPCDQTFRKHKTLQAHISSAHLNQKPFQCSYIDEDTGKTCGHAYETDSKLESHVKRVHGGERYYCTICEPVETNPINDAESSFSQVSGFKTFHALQNHIKECHPPVCTECSQAFSSHRELRSHIDLRHELEPLDERRSHICEECGKGFTKEGNLKVHVNNVHRNIRKFVCNQASFKTSKFEELVAWDGQNACDGSFKTKQQLESHVRKEHLGLESAWMTKRRKKLASGDMELRKEGFFPRPQRQEVSLLTQLTGAGYEDHRPIACLRQNCEYRFVREYDLKQHCGTAHGMADFEIAEAIQERDALNGGQFWLGGIDPEHEDDEELSNGASGLPSQDSLNVGSDPWAPQGLPLPDADESYSMEDAVMQYLNYST